MSKSKNITKKIYPKTHKKTLALLISAHNEELVLENTVLSAIKAGMKPEDIYIVDDSSEDLTSEIAARLVGPHNTIKVFRSGKGLALTKAARHFGLVKKYRWIHIADADGAFSPNYFRVFRRSIRVKNAAATGYVKSLPGGIVSQYRIFEYTIGMEMHRRFQALTHTVSVIPGPTSCFRSDVFEKLNFANKSLTEDFDVTLQIHRLKLGNIQFIPNGIAHTQDPKNVSDFIKQITRWNRGILQGLIRHKIGRRAQRIDLYLSYQLLQTGLFFLNYFVLAPYLSFHFETPNYLAAAFLYDIAIMFILTLLVAIRTNRWTVLSAFPNIYALRWLSLFVFLKTLFEVGLLRKYSAADGGVWNTAGRRYKPTSF